MVDLLKFCYKVYTDERDSFVYELRVELYIVNLFTAGHRIAYLPTIDYRLDNNNTIANIKGLANALCFVNCSSRRTFVQVLLG